MKSLKNVRQVFRLIRLLNTPPARDVKQLMRILNASSSQIYRQINLLKELGYRIQTDKNNRKSFETAISQYSNESIDEEELVHLQDILRQASAKHPLTVSILNKLDSNLSFIPLADSLPMLHINRNIQLIRIGIERNFCVLLCNYRSQTSNTVKNIKIEPLEFTDDYKYLIAYDVEKADQRQFKLSRIEAVEVLDQRATSNWEASPIDIFGLTGKEWIPIKMELSPLAYHLLVEDFPLSSSYISKNQGKIIFDGLVRDFKGIGRFVLGLPGEITVCAPQSFKTYLEEKIQLF